MSEKTCVDLVQDSYYNMVGDLAIMLNAMYLGDDDEERDEVEKHGLGILNEWGLSFEYVYDDDEPFWRFLISYGGPSSELRFFAYTADGKCQKIEYWYMDWFDGAHIRVEYDPIVNEFWQHLVDIGAPRYARDNAIKEIVR